MPRKRPLRNLPTEIDFEGLLQEPPNQNLPRRQALSARQQEYVQDSNLAPLPFQAFTLTRRITNPSVALAMDGIWLAIAAMEPAVRQQWKISGGRRLTTIVTSAPNIEKVIKNHPGKDRMRTDRETVQSILSLARPSATVQAGDIYLVRPPKHTDNPPQETPRAELRILYPSDPHSRMIRKLCVEK